MRERPAGAKQLRGLFLEYGIASAAGIQRLRRALPRILSAETETFPPLAREVVLELPGRFREGDEGSASHARQIAPLARQTEAAERLRQVEGVGPIPATALVATVGDAKACAHGRQFAAWLGLVPEQFRSGGKAGWGRGPKHGNVSLRTLGIPGARAVLPSTAKRPKAKRVWVEALRQRRGDNIAAVALAAQPARLVGAVLAGGQDAHVAA